MVLIFTYALCPHHVNSIGDGLHAYPKFYYVL